MQSIAVASGAEDAEQIAEELVRLYEMGPPEFIDVCRLTVVHQASGEGFVTCDGATGGCRPKKEVAPPATPWTSPPPMLLKSPSDELLEDPQQEVQEDADPERQARTAVGLGSARALWASGSGEHPGAWHCRSAGRRRAAEFRWQLTEPQS